MRLDLGRRLTFAGLALSTFMILSGAFASPVMAEEKPGSTPPAATDSTPSTTPQAPTSQTPTPQTEKPDAVPPTKPNTAEPDGAAPGVPSDSSAEPIDIPAKPCAFVHGQAKWDEGFASIKDAFAKVKDALGKANLKQGGNPITVFTQTDDNGFSYDAMVPLADKPDANVQLSGDVKLGLTPSGKAIKFEHRGAYDDIDSTYDLITAYLDEKGLEARNFFVEQYLTELKTSDDQNLAVDIYVFIK